MVEDEFYAVAQTFTQHLHHAEYVRRKKEAKLKNATAIKDLERPTDGKTMMRKETKKQKGSEELASRQRKGLDEIRGKRPRVDSEEEEGSDLEEDRDDDPWVGTSLHTLMTSPRKARSLIGLQGIKSSTRAAAGYGQASGLTRKDDRHQPSPEPRRQEAHTVTVDETASEDDDDLEITHATTSKATPFHQVYSKEQAPVKREDAGTPTIKEEKPDIGKSSDYYSEKRAATSANHATYSSSTAASSKVNSRKKMLLDELDDVPETHETKSNGRRIIQDQPRSSSSAEPPPSRPQEKDSKKSRFSEVPTFLV